MTSTETVESAKQFLLNRLIQQASLDEIVLSDLEKRMFFFSELSANPDWEANEKFEAEYDDSEYEKKVAKLLRHAYSHDVKNPVCEERLARMPQGAQQGRLLWSRYGRSSEDSPAEKPINVSFNL